MFDAKVLIKRLPSFSAPKITVIGHVKPILKLQQTWQTRQSYEKPLVPLKLLFKLNRRKFPTTLSVLKLKHLFKLNGKTFPANIFSLNTKILETDSRLLFRKAMKHAYGTMLNKKAKRQVVDRDQFDQHTV